MHLISVNVGQVRAMANAKKYGKTGIYKLPQAGPVELGPLGLRGDAIVDVENHGGHDQAVYLYGWEDYEWWARELGQELLPGTFGENLTIRGLESAGILAGDRFRIGAVLLEATCPRVPCVTLGVRMGDPQFVKRFRRAGRPGVYCRVLETGSIAAGSPVEYLRYPGVQVSMQEMFENFYRPSQEAEYLHRYLSAPTPLKGREEIQATLRELEGKAG